MTTTPTDSTRRATSRRLIGRGTALARLEDAYSAAVEADRAGTVLLEGPAGIGKTRVVQAFADRVAERDGVVLVGGCVFLGDEILPYAPIAELLRGLVARVGPDAVRGWAGTAASDLARLVPPLASDTGRLEPTTASVSRLFQACCSLFDEMSRRHPLVLVVEDLHWADRSTRELLSLLAHQLGGSVLLVLTLRTDESPRDPGIARLIAELGRRAGDRVVLEPLTRDEQAHQISDILGAPPTAVLLDQVYVRAEGNPFFAEELLALETDGVLPPTVRELLLARLDALAPATRQVLRTASVVGRTVPAALLDSVSPLRGDALEQALRPAVDQHVLVPDVRSGVYLFRHALLQEAIAASLLPTEASRMHTQVAQALEKSPRLAGETGFVAGRVARHWHAAGEGDRALVASVAAAREAKSALAFSESLTHYERALSLIDAAPARGSLLDRPTHELLRSAAEVAHLAASPARAAELVQQAIAEVDPGDEIGHAYLHERLGRYLWMAADGQGSLAAYERAVSLLPDGAPSRWHAAVLSGYSQILMLASRYAESEQLARQAIEIARAAPDGRSVEGHARCNLGVDLARQGHLEAGVAEIEEARRIAEEEFDDVDDIARAIVNLASIYDEAGLVAQSVEVALEGVVEVERLGLKRRKGVWCRCDAAESLARLGRHEEARRLLDEAVALVPSGVDDLRTKLVSGQVSLQLGDFVGAQSHLNGAFQMGDHLLDGQLVGPLYQGLIEVSTWLGDFEAAQGWARAGAARLAPGEDPVYAIPVFTAAIAAEAEARLARGAPRSPLAHDEWFARITASRDGGAEHSPAAVAHAGVAACEAARGENEDDGGAWLEVAAAWDEVADPYRASYARIRAVQALLRDGEDRTLAASELVTAAHQASDIGSAHLVALADDVARRGRLQPVSPEAETDNPYRLTPRERDVLGLVAEGLSDREIGSRLFISHRTVERHVSNLLAKLGARRRSELAALVHRLGVVPVSDPG